jgi:hypothetical protein
MKWLKRDGPASGTFKTLNLKVNFVNHFGRARRGGVVLANIGFHQPGAASLSVWVAACPPSSVAEKSQGCTRTRRRTGDQQPPTSPTLSLLRRTLSRYPPPASSQQSAPSFLLGRRGFSERGACEVWRCGGAGEEEWHLWRSSFSLIPALAREQQAPQPSGYTPYASHNTDASPSLQPYTSHGAAPPSASIPRASDDC